MYLTTLFSGDELLDLALKILEREAYIIKEKEGWKLTIKGQIVSREVFHH